MNKLNDIGILSLKNGTIYGISGILLNESIWKKIDVIVFVVDVISGMTNFRAVAANVVQAVSKLYPKRIVK
jgi:predicted ATP-grasp superfamily ATP-dependent carboligase